MPDPTPASTPTTSPAAAATAAASGAPSGVAGAAPPSAAPSAAPSPATFQAATAAELKEAFPDDPAFCFTAISEGLTMVAALQRRVSDLTARVGAIETARPKPAGRQAPVETGAPAANAGDADAAPKTYIQACALIARSDPKLHPHAVADKAKTQYLALWQAWKEDGFPAGREIFAGRFSAA